MSNRIFIVFATFNNSQKARITIEQLNNQTTPYYRLLIVDHGQKQLLLTETEIKNEKIIKIEGSVDEWWTASINRGLKYILNTFELAVSDTLFIITDDNTFPTNFLEILNQEVIKRKVAVGCPAINNLTNEVIHCDIIFNKYRGTNTYRNLNKKVDQLKKSYHTDLLKGRCICAPLSCLKEVGLLNELLPQYKSDHEYTVRLKRRYGQPFVTTLVYLHTNLETQEKIAKFFDVNNFFFYFFGKKSTANNYYSLIYYLQTYKILGVYYYLIYTLASIKYYFTSSLRQ
ncbi:glycosyltransferase [bacterium]|nr:glycosyltransferase [bacterium]MDA7660296.1 glycosyltransferase [Verrucomicrobiota bacterium]